MNDGQIRLRPTVILVARGAALALAVAAISTDTADGQGLKNRLKRRLENVVEDKTVQEAEKAVGGQPAGKGGAVRFDSVIVELDQNRVERVLISFGAGKRILDGADGGLGVVTLAARREEAIERRGVLSDKHQKELDTYRSNSNRIRDCRDDALGKINDVRQADYQKRVMSDPVLQQKMVAFAHQIAAAQAAGDTAAMFKINREMQTVAKGAATPADSAAVDKQCGTMPATPAVLATMDSLDGLSRKYNEQIRKTEERAAAAEQAAAGGLDARQLAMARERIEMFLASGGSQKPRGFSPTELEALSARRQDLQKLM